MQIGEIVRVSANVCTCYSSNIPQFWCLLYGQLCVNTFLTPFRVHAYIQRRDEGLWASCLSLQNSSIGLQLWKDLIRHLGLIAVTDFKFASRFKFTLLPRKPALYSMIWARLKDAGIDAARKSGMCWDLIRNIPVRPSATRTGLQNYCILLVSCKWQEFKNKRFNAAQSCLSTSPAGLVKV